MKSVIFQRFHWTIPSTTSGFFSKVWRICLFSCPSKRGMQTCWVFHILWPCCYQVGFTQNVVLTPFQKVLLGYLQELPRSSPQITFRTPPEVSSGIAGFLMIFSECLLRIRTELLRLLNRFHQGFLQKSSLDFSRDFSRNSLWDYPSYRIPPGVLLRVPSIVSSGGFLPAVSPGLPPKILSWMVSRNPSQILQACFPGFHHHSYIYSMCGSFRS